MHHNDLPLRTLRRQIRQHTHHGCRTNALGNQHHRIIAISENQITSRECCLNRISHSNMIVQKLRDFARTLHRHPIAGGCLLIGTIQQGILAQLAGAIRKNNTNGRVLPWTWGRQPFTHEREFSHRIRKRFLVSHRHITEHIPRSHT